MTAATADSRYAIGASPNLVAICTPARAVAASAKTPYTAIRMRPGPCFVAAGSVISDRPKVVQPQLEDRDHQTRDSQRAGTPPAALGQRPERPDRQDDQRPDQVPDEERPGHVPVGPGVLRDPDDQ